MLNVSDGAAEDALHLPARFGFRKATHILGQMLQRISVLEGFFGAVEGCDTLESLFLLHT